MVSPVVVPYERVAQEKNVWFLPSQLPPVKKRLHPKRPEKRDKAERERLVSTPDFPLIMYAR